MSITLRKCVLALLLWASGAQCGFAHPAEPISEITVSPTEVTVGEPVTVRIAVYTPTWFPSPPVFPPLELPGAVTRIPANSARPVSRRVGTETWSGVVRTYNVYPLSAARYRLDQLAVRVKYADPGKTPLAAAVPVDDLVFTAQVPAGAEGLDPYVAGREFTLERSVEGVNNDLAVGDALVVKTVAQLEGLPAIFIPEITEPPDIPGVSAYPSAARVNDELPARRSEELTLVLNAGGEYELPAVSINWWNLETDQIETATLPAVGFSVTGPPLDSEVETASEQRSWWPLILGALLLVIVVMRLPALWQSVAGSVAARRREREASEEHAWHAARSAMSHGDAAQAYHALVAWQHRLAPEIALRAWVLQWGDAALVNELDRLADALYGDGEAAVDLASLSTGFSRARDRALAAAAGSATSTLPVLNP